MKWTRLKMASALLALLVCGLDLEVPGTGIPDATTLAAAETPKKSAKKGSTSKKSANTTAAGKSADKASAESRVDDDDEDLRSDEDDDAQKKKKKPARKRTSRKRPGRMPVGVGRNMPARPATGNRPQGNFGGNNPGIGGNDSSPAADSESAGETTGGAGAAEDAVAGTGNPAAEGATGRGMQGTPPPASLNAGYGPKKKGPPDPKVVKKVMRIQERHTERLLSQVGVAGTGTGIDGEGNVVVKVYTTGEGNPRIPETLDGVPVVRSMMGPFYSKGLPKFNPRTRATRPVPIGVSCMGYSPTLCATGTLGCRLKSADGSLFILSNNHVLALENTAKVDSTVAVQPGPLDAAFPCFTDPSSGVGLLYDYVPIAFKGVENHVDAAIATTAAEYVTTSTPYGGYGVPTSTVATAYVGQRVQKYGRTTDYTVGYVSAINVTSFVNYDKGLALFVGQIAVLADTGAMGGPGDSGSLVVDMNRNPVGLLFAGSAGSGMIIMNPIQTVLDSFKVEVEVDSSPRSPAGKHGHWVP